MGEPGSFQCSPLEHGWTGRQLASFMRSRLSDWGELDAGRPAHRAVRRARLRPASTAARSALRCSRSRRFASAWATVFGDSAGCSRYRGAPSAARNHATAFEWAGSSSSPRLSLYRSPVRVFLDRSEPTKLQVATRELGESRSASHVGGGRGADEELLPCLPPRNFVAAFNKSTVVDAGDVHGTPLRVVRRSQPRLKRLGPDPVVAGPAEPVGLELARQDRATDCGAVAAGPTSGGPRYLEATSSITPCSEVEPWCIGSNYGDCPLSLSTNSGI